MKHLFFSTSPILQGQVLAALRVLIGALMIYHGQEIFQPDLMQEYMNWETFQSSNAWLLVYVGKSSELLAGVSLLLGLFTRLGSLLLIGTMSYVTFFVGNGQFWYEDQHPFMFVLFGIFFLFIGPGSWSMDGLLFKGKSPEL